MSAPGVNRLPTVHALAWGAFLACSWTWCIGMFLPGIMWRDYGLWGWIAFATPNVIGAGAMGFVLARREQSQAIVLQHRLACLAFSLVTIAFHGYWMVWFLRHVVGVEGLGFVLLIAASTWGIGRSRTWRVAVLGLGVWVLSVVFLFGGVYRGLTMWPGAGMAATDALLKEGLLWLLPMLCFGFFLSPYLDLTFHQAAQHTDAPRRRIAFGVGFGVMFLTMIVFSLLYARLQFDAFDEPGSPRAARLIALVSTHMIVQVGFTVGVHCLAVSQHGHAKPSHLRAGALCGGALLIGAAIGALVNQLSGNPTIVGERVYLCFLGAYGLVFPAYVWIALVPHRWRDRSTPAGRVTAMVIVLVAGFPLMWFGFIEGHRVLLLPAVIIALLSPVLSVGKSRSNLTP